MSKLELLNNYIEAKQQLTKWKALEAELRLELLKESFGDVLVGTETTYINGMEVKGTFKMTKKLDAKELDRIFDNMSEEEQECINYKPALVLSKYNSLEEDQRVMLDDCITESPAMPTLVIKQVEDDE